MDVISSNTILRKLSKIALHKLLHSTLKGEFSHKTFAIVTCGDKIDTNIALPSKSFDQILFEQSVCQKKVPSSANLAVRKLPNMSTRHLLRTVWTNNNVISFAMEPSRYLELVHEKLKKIGLPGRKVKACTKAAKYVHTTSRISFQNSLPNPINNS